MKTNDLVRGLSSDGAFVVSESHVKPENRPGEICEVLCPEGYRYFRYMKAEEAFAIGQVAMVAALIDNADVDQAQAAGTNILKATGDFTANDFGASIGAKWPDAFVSIDANGTGIGQTRHIKSNRQSTDYLTLDKNWDTALTTSSDYVTYAPNYVSLCDTDDVSAVASRVRGVAISAVTDEYWAWFQIRGFCPLVRFVGTTDPAVRGAPIVPSSTAGAAKGYTNGGITATDAATMFGYAEHAYAEADAAGVGIAATLFII